MDMVLHRYGGGLSRKSMEDFLSMPFRPLVRLIGAAVRAATPQKNVRQQTEDEERATIALLKAKKADLATLAKAEAMQAARAARAAASGGKR